MGLDWGWSQLYRPPAPQNPNPEPQKMEYTHTAASFMHYKVQILSGMSILDRNEIRR